MARPVPLCRLVVAMHAFGGGSFLGNAQINNVGVVLVDGGSYLVALLFTLGLCELASAKLSAVLVRDVFGQQYQRIIDGMHTHHQHAEEQLLIASSAHSGRRDSDDNTSESLTAPPFADFEKLFLRDALAEPCRNRWLRPLLYCHEGVRRVFLLDVPGSKVVLTLSRGASSSYNGGDAVCTTLHEPRDDTAWTGMFGPFLRQCWDTIFGYARVLCEDEHPDTHKSSGKRSEEERKPQGRVVLSLSFRDGVAAGQMPCDQNSEGSITICFKAVQLARPACLVLLYQCPSTMEREEKWQFKQASWPLASQMQAEMLRYQYFPDSYSLHTDGSKVGVVPLRVEHALRSCANDISDEHPI